MAIRAMTDLARRLAPTGREVIVPHQANRRILEDCRSRCQWDADRFVINIADFGNTAAASVPPALRDAWRSGAVQPGDRSVLLGFGAGYTWGGLAFDWTLAAPGPDAPDLDPARPLTTVDR